MKYKTTLTAIRNGYNRIISIGYCNAQYLLRYEREQSYCAGVYGWNCDNYDVDGVAISTGYRPVSSKNAKTDYAHIQRYEDAARAIVCNYSLTHDEQCEQVTTLLKQFVAECIA